MASIFMTGCQCSEASKHYDQAINHQATANYKDALSEINKALKVEPQNKKYLMLRDQLQQSLKKQQEAH